MYQWYILSASGLSSRVFKCVTAITGISERGRDLSCFPLTGHSPHTPLGFFACDSKRETETPPREVFHSTIHMTDDSPDDLSDAEDDTDIRERDLDADELFDIYIFEEETDVNAFRYT